MQGGGGGFVSLNSFIVRVEHVKYEFVHHICQYIYIHEYIYIYI